MGLFNKSEKEYYNEILKHVKQHAGEDAELNSLLEKYSEKIQPQAFIEDLIGLIKNNKEVIGEIDDPSNPEANWVGLVKEKLPEVSEKFIDEKSDSFKSLKGFIVFLLGQLDNNQKEQSESIVENQPPSQEEDANEDESPKRQLSVKEKTEEVETETDIVEEPSQEEDANEDESPKRQLSVKEKTEEVETETDTVEEPLQEETYQLNAFPYEKLSTEDQEIYKQYMTNQDGKQIINFATVLESKESTPQKQWLQVKDSIDRFEKHLTEDKEKWETAKIDFEYWKGYISRLAANYEDDLLYEISELLADARFYAQPADKLLTLSIPADVKKAFMQLERTIPQLQKIVEEKDFSFSKLSELKGAMVRSKSDLDFLIDSGDTMPNKTEAFLKEKFVSLILNYKNLLNCRKDLSMLLQKALKSASVFEDQLKEIAPKYYEKVFAGGNENAIIGILEMEKPWLEENFQKANKAKETAEGLRKAYVSFLKKSIFRASTGIADAKNIFEETKEDDILLNNWMSIFDELEKVCTDFLENHLHIIPLETERGDSYQYLLHNPFGESEPDEELENEKIRQVISPGFRLLSKENNAETGEDLKKVEIETIIEKFPDLVLKQADVIVVKN